MDIVVDAVVDALVVPQVDVVVDPEVNVGKTVVVDTVAVLSGEGVG